MFHDKVRFLEKLDICAYESEEGVCFKFHEVIIGLTELCLEKVKRRKIHEAKIHSRVGKELSGDRLLRRKEFNSRHAHTLMLLKIGLRNWRHISTKKGLYFGLNGLVDSEKKRQPNFSVFDYE